MSKFQEITIINLNKILAFGICYLEFEFDS